jgi:hypothetical protein
MAVQTSAPGPAVSRLAGPALVGAAVALAVGVYGNVHDPTGEALFTLFFTATLNMKAWLATIVLLLAGFQLLSAARLYGKVHIPRQVPPWLGQAHRLSGTLAFLVSLPVAYHCLWSLGFESDPDQTRLVVRSRSLPGWALPAAGGALFTSVVVLWLSSALWFFDTVGFPEF